MAAQEYNGWTNYPTWNVALWLDNEQGSHETMIEIARTTTDTTHGTGEWAYTRDRVHVMADAIQEYVTDPDCGYGFPTDGMAADLIGYALGQVNWEEIAQHYANDFPYEAGEDEDED